MICGFKGPDVMITELWFEAGSVGPGAGGSGLSGLPDLPLRVGTGEESRKRSGVLRPSLSLDFFRVWLAMNVPKLVLRPWPLSWGVGGLSAADEVLRCERPVMSPETSSGRPPIGPVGVVSSDDIGKRLIFCCLSTSSREYEWVSATQA